MYAEIPRANIRPSLGAPVVRHRPHPLADPNGNQVRSLAATHGACYKSPGLIRVLVPTGDPQCG